MNSSVYLANEKFEHDSVALSIAGKFDQAIDTIALAAQQFSHLAKIATGESRAHLYQAKSSLISLAFELEGTAFIVDAFDVKKRSVGLDRQANGVRLHTPMDELSPKARALISEQLLKLLKVA